MMTANSVTMWLALIQGWINLALGLLTLVISVWALGDCLLRPASAFSVEGKKSKGFWMLLNAIATLLAFAGMAGLGILGLTGGFSILLLIIPGVYFADVRPVVRGYRRSRNGRPGQSGRFGRNDSFGDRPRGPRDW